MPALKSFKTIAFSVLVLIVAADFLFYDVPFGISAALAALLLFIGALLQMPPARRNEKTTRWVGGAAGGLFLALLWNPFPLPVVLMAATLALLAMAGKVGWAGTSGLWLKRLTAFACLGWTQLWRDSAILDRWKKTGHSRKSFFNGSEFKRRWAFPIAVTLGFLVLFAFANPLISNWLLQALEKFEALFKDFEVPPLPRILLWIGTVLLTWAFFRFRPKSRAAVFESNSPTLQSVERVSTDTLIRSLILLNILFAFMNLLDLRYLWGGAALPDGMTYAAYAQRGAYPLVISALLAGFFVLMTFRSGGSAEASKTARRLVGLWVAQNIFLTVSAGWRLGIYIDVYSLTRLRIAAAIWMGLVACGLLWICLRVLQHKSNRWLIQRNLAMLGVVLYLAAFVNFDGYIARYNTEKCLEITGSGAPLDWQYLAELGPEALPAVRNLETVDGVDHAFHLDRRRIEADLERQLTASLSDWRGWTLLRNRLKRAE